MFIPQIKVDQQIFGTLGIRSSHARMQITKPTGQMRIQNTRPQVDISTQMPTFRVPRERLRSELGLAGPLSFAKQFRDKGRSSAHQATAAYASDGDFIANKNIPGDKSIPMLSKNRMNRIIQKPNTNIGLMPSSPPSLEWTKGHIQVNASRHNISVDWSGENMASVSVDTGYPVEVSLTGRPHFRIASIEPAVNNSTYSRFIDRSV